MPDFGVQSDFERDRADSVVPLAVRLVTYVLACTIGAAIISPLSGFEGDNWLEYCAYQFGLAAWTAQSLILVAVLTLTIPSRIVSFQLALLAALLQGYAYMALHTYWSGSMDGDSWDRQLRFAVLLGLSATLGAVLWLIVRIVAKMVLSPEAIEGQGRSGQFGLRELLYLMASLSAVVAFVSLFSMPRVIPMEQVLANTLGSALATWPLVYAPFWLAPHRPVVTWSWLWMTPLVLLIAAFTASQQFAGSPWGRPSHYVTASYLGTVLGSALVVAANALALQVLGLTWRRGGVAATATGTRAAGEAG